ncbi:hypothetical protein BT63DRAFT_425332 [Microthyrium microscopicum]|uniref:Velvet domain-containing protein n=1 Tax=Microthyrium microscopicum TaxID=703497 RepID=A0A6A6UBZ0_9PEZI|nr:hypothetical protein BT63DRAFT_425332 [Microthyrium microscopicum]
MASGYQFPHPHQAQYDQQQLTYANSNSMAVQPPQSAHQQMHHQSNQQHHYSIAPMSHVFEGRRYELFVGQEPVRARMCGFGDKDRRPITPPPCVRLRVTDAETGVEIPPENIDTTFFVLTVDLWSQDASHEANLVRHSSSSPAMSISASTTTSFPPQPERIMTFLAQPTTYAIAAPHLAGGHYAQVAGAVGGQVGSVMPINSQGQPLMLVASSYGSPAAYAANGYAAPQQLVQMPMAASHGQHTRNLIGSLAVSAAKLKDERGEMGIWFVLQDLSVRQEGKFRLRFAFVSVANCDKNAPTAGAAPILATCFSDTFTVYSAKKFPGVIESTALSKAFAQQGVKIPIRKDVKVSHQEEFDRDDENDRLS